MSSVNVSNGSRLFVNKSDPCGGNDRPVIPEVVVISLALIAVFINIFLFVIIRVSGSLIRMPGITTLTLLEILLNLFITASHAMAMIVLSKVRIPEMIVALVYTLVFVNTTLAIIHGLRNFWILLLAVIRAAVVVDPFLQRRFIILSAKRQIILLILFSILPLLGMIPLFVPNSLDEPWVKVVRVVKLILEGIVPGVGMLISAALIAFYIRRSHKKHQQSIRTSTRVNNNNSRVSVTRKDNTATKIVVSLSLGFLLLEWPMNIIQLKAGISRCGITPEVQTAIICLVSLNSCINFVVFSFWSPAFRVTLTRLVQCKGVRAPSLPSQSVLLRHQSTVTRLTDKHNSDNSCRKREINIVEMQNLLEDNASPK